MKRKGGLEKDGGWEKDERRGGMEESVGWRERRTGSRLKMEGKQVKEDAGRTEREEWKGMQD